MGGQGLRQAELDLPVRGGFGLRDTFKMRWSLGARFVEQRERDLRLLERLPIPLVDDTHLDDLPEAHRVKPQR